jgi:hydroxymethylglutaryl-CoA lyase
VTHGPTALPAAISLREVGPRDGLQAERPVPVADRVAFVRALAAAGLRTIEFGSFVSPRAVPAMAGAAAVAEGLRGLDDVTLVALVPNARGAREAVTAGVDALTCTISASAVYNRRNVGMTIAESVAAIDRVTTIAHDASLGVDVVLSCAFGSPYEGEIAVDDVERLAAACRDVGADALTLADTTGMATPRGVWQVLERTGPDVALHFHETRGTGLVNVLAALQVGVTRFDTSIGGLGGSPFARGAAGNVATEGVVSMADDLGIATGVDLAALLRLGADLTEAVGHALPSPVMVAGARVG